ncbi:Plasma membrane sulfite pump involved in sulfite metabolism [Ascosphaera atra]|nr:Plasma membrane sulfite pump involved in sulfite metabolism [Ascosphaera atra]
MGIGAFCLMQLGRDCREIFPQLDVLSEQAGEIIYIGGLMIGLCMWGITLIWLWFAVAAFAVRRFPFNLGWWALVFPFGAWNVATCQIGEEFDFAFFKVLATIVVFILLLNWLMVFSLTLWRTVTGQIFLTG